MFLIPQVTQLSLSFSLSLVFVDSRMTRMMDMVRDYRESKWSVCIFYGNGFQGRIFPCYTFYSEKIEKMLEGKGRK